MQNMRGLRVRDINDTWDRFGQTGRILRATKSKIYWISDVDGEVLVDKHAELEITKRITRNGEING